MRVSGRAETLFMILANLTIALDLSEGIDLDDAVACDSFAEVEIIGKLYVRESFQ